MMVQAPFWAFSGSRKGVLSKGRCLIGRSEGSLFKSLVGLGLAIFLWFSRLGVTFLVKNGMQFKKLVYGSARAVFL